MGFPPCLPSLQTPIHKGGGLWPFHNGTGCLWPPQGGRPSASGRLHKGGPTQPTPIRKGGGLRPPPQRGGGLRLPPPCGNLKTTVADVLIGRCAQAFAEVHVNIQKKNYWNCTCPGNCANLLGVNSPASADTCRADGQRALEVTLRHWDAL